MVKTGKKGKKGNRGARGGPARLRRNQYSVSSLISTQRWPIVAFVLVVLLDFCCAIILQLALNDWKLDWLSGIFSLIADFRHQAADLCLAALFRLVIIPLLTCIGAYYGSSDRMLMKARGAKRQESGSAASANHFSINDSESAALLSGDALADVHQQTADEAYNADISVDLLGDDEAIATKSVDELLKAAELTLGIEKKANRRANICHWLNFAILTLSMVHCGIKAVLFVFPSKVYTLSAVITSLLIVWMSAELFLSRSLLERFTKREGQLNPQIHLHALFFDSEVAGHYCDNCRSRIKERRAYRCGMCDFDICMRCFRNRAKGQGEGIVRGDKGVKEVETMTTFQYFKKAMRFAQPQWPMIILATLMLLISTAARLFVPNYQGKIFDRVIKMDFDGFRQDVIFYVSLAAGIGFFGGIRSLCFGLVSIRISKYVRDKFFKQTMDQDIAMFDSVKSGDLTGRLSGDIYAMISPIRSTLSNTLGAILTLVGGLVMCLHTSWRLSLLAFTTIAPIIMLYKVYSRWSKNVQKLIWAAWGDANATATEAIKNIRTVRGFGTEQIEVDHFMEATSEGRSLGTKDALMSAGTFALSQYIDLAVSVLVLYVGGSLVMETEKHMDLEPEDQGLSVGSLITFQLYWNMLQNSYNSLTNVVTRFTRAAGAAERVFEILDHMPDIPPDGGSPLPVSIKGEVDIENVRFTYQMRPDSEVLKGVSLKIPAGKTVALVGKSGGGKSTLVHLLQRFYDPTDGCIKLDGTDIREYNATQYRRLFGVVSQNCELFDNTIAGNICYGTEAWTEQELHHAAKLANAHDFIEEFEDGYQTRVGESGVRLSGGQRQRIAIARMLLRKPKILLLDEATSALDAESEALVQEAIDTLLTTGSTILLVAHRLSTVVNSDLICVVNQGMIAESGTHAELIEKQGIYANLVKRQMVRDANSLESKLGVSVDDIFDEAVKD